MSYIGKSPSIGSYSMLDNLTASATASYSLTLDSVAFVPESANHLIVSLNGVIQKAGSSFTVSGSTLTFSSALTSSDSIDFVLALGSVLDIGTPSDATVTNAKTNFVSTSSAAGLQIKGDGTTDGTLQLNCSQNSHGIKLKSPNHASSSSYTLTFPATDPSADKFLKTDGSGNLSFADAGGTYTLISTTNVSDAATVDITGMDSTYQNYLITLTNVHPQTDNVTLNGRYIIGGSVKTGAYYDYINHCVQRGDTNVVNSSSDATSSKLIHSSAGAIATESLSGEIKIFNPSETTFKKMIQAHISYLNTSAASCHNVNTTHYTANQSALTGLQFFFTSGNIQSGIIKLYGMS